MTRSMIVGGLTLSLTGLLAGTPHQQADPKVTMTISAMRASKALRLLGSYVHMTFETSPQTANEVVAFRFTDVPLSEAMRRIAEAVDGSWKQEESDTRLIRTADQARSERALEYAQDVDAIRKSINKRAEELKKMPVWSNSEADALALQVKSLVKSFNPNNRDGKWYQQATHLSESGPLGRTMTQIASLLDPKELAELPPYLTTVWSSSPTATQRPIPSEVWPIIQQFTHDQSDWLASRCRETPAERSNFWGSDLLGGRLWRFPKSVERGCCDGDVLSPPKEMGPYRFGLNLTFSAYDQKGKRIGQAQTSLGNTFDDYSDVMKDVEPPPGEKLITAEGDGKELLDAQPSWPRKPSKELSPGLLAKITNPEEFDPLSFFMSSGLEQVAEIRGLNMVSCLPDTSIYGAVIAPGKDVGINQFLQRMKFFQTSAVLKDGWLIVQSQPVPMKPEIPRLIAKLLPNTCSGSSSKKSLTIDESAYFALALPDSTQANYLPSTMANFLITPDNNYYEPNMLRLYGLLTPQQKQQMSTGGLPFGSLNEDELMYVNRMVYGLNANLQYRPPQGQGINSGDWDLFYNGIMREPTESLPTGIPSRGLLKMTTEQFGCGNRFNGAGPAGLRRNTSDDAQRDMAWQKFCQDRPDLFPWAVNNGLYNFNHFQYGQRLQLTFDFNFTDSISINQTLEEKNMSEFKDITMNDLPDDFKKQFQTRTTISSSSLTRT